MLEELPPAVPSGTKTAHLHSAPHLTVVDPGLDPASAVVRLHEALGRDLVYRFRLRPEPGFEYVSRSCVDLTGYTPEEHYADPQLGLKLVHPDDVGILHAITAGTAGRGPYILRWIRRDGTVLWTEHHTVLVPDASGEPCAIEGIARDVTDIALAGESARATQLGTRSFLQSASSLAVIVDPVGRLVFANEAFLALTGYAADDVAGREWSRLFRDDTEPGPDTPAPPDQADAGTPRRETESTIRLRDGRRHRIRWSSMAILDARGRLTGTASLGDDRTQAAENEGRLIQLNAAVQHTSDSVVIADADGQIVYVNPAFERTTGYSAAEAIGQNPRLLKSGHQSPGFYRAMWWRLGRGRTWRGEFVNRRKDGTLLIEEAVITPVGAVAGGRPGYVAVKRDVTSLRQLRANLDDVHRQRELLGVALERLSPRATADQSCDDLAEVLGELPDVISAAVALVDRAGGLRVRSLRSPAGMVRPEALELPVGIRHLALERFDQGPWVETIRAHDGHPFADHFRDDGVGAVLLAPVRTEDTALGILILGSADDDAADVLAQLPAVSQVAAVARSLLAPHVLEAAARARTRERITSLIEHRAYRTLFQPIVDLHSGRVIGFEGLTRFDAGGGPAETFAEAAGCGLGVSLEVATATLALEMARQLPAGAFLALNVSPALLLNHEILRDLLTVADRSVIIEVTEHSVIEDYAAMRDAIERLGPQARIAIDDVGSGVANFRHLVELRPEFVKLDISLVRDIDTDLTRQALVVGLKEFARVSGRALIAEGIETELERTTLGELGVSYGQGYLLGAPAAVSSWQGVEVDPEVANGRTRP